MKASKIQYWWSGSGGGAVQRIQSAINSYIADPVLSPTSISESSYEALTYYENRVYTLDDGAVYNRATLTTPPTDVYGVGDLHVATTGNDTTGNGSEGNPYLTVNKGIDSAPAGGNITVWLHGGTFAENVSASGYLQKNNKTFTVPIKVKGIQGVTSTITAVSGIRVIYFGGTSSNVIFQNVTILAIAATTRMVEFPGAATGFEFRDCVFTGNSSNINAVLASGVGGANLKVKRCTFTSVTGGLNVSMSNMANGTVIGNVLTADDNGLGGTGTGCSGTFYISNNTITCNGGTSAISSTAVSSAGIVINIIRNTIVNTNGGGIRVVGGSATNSVAVNIDFNDVDVTGDGILALDYVDGQGVRGNIVHTSGILGIGCPSDSHSTTTFSTKNLDVSYNQIFCTGAIGHSFIFGTDSETNSFTYNISDARGGGSYGAVCKGASHNVNNNVVYGGINSSLLLKGCDDYVIEDNYFYQDGTGAAFRFDGDPTDPAGNTITDNIFVAVNANARLFTIPATEIGLNNFVDRNKYYVESPATWDELLVAPDITSLSEAQAKWAANYPSGATNDANSTQLTTLPS
jgi:hypothetical protein